MQKKICAYLLVACFMIGMLVFPVHAETAEGIYGNNINWHLNLATGTLTISGTGVVPRVYEASGEAYDPHRLNIRHIVIEDGITEIAPYAFKHIYNLESIHIGDTVVEIGEAAFADNFNVTEVYIGKSVTTIGAQAFGYLESLKSLILPPSVHTIEGEAFSLCGLTELVIPEGVTAIEAGAFRANANLTRITIPTSVVLIKNGAFRDCVNLKDVYYTGTQAQWDEINIQNNDEIVADAQTGDNTPLLNATVHYNHTHSWNEGTVITAPGCKTEGEKDCTCTECGATGTVKIAPQHTWDSGTTNADTTVTYECTKCKETKTEGTPVTETEPPVTEPPATEPPVTEPPATEPPVTEPPATEPPATEPPVTEPPVTEPPATEPPATDNATADGTETTDPVHTEQEKPADAPWVAICIGTAAVLAGGGAAVWVWLRKKRSGPAT